MVKENNEINIESKILLSVYKDVKYIKLNL